MNGANGNRYCDYAHRLRCIEGLHSNQPEHPRSLRELPHSQDPRCERSLHRLLEFERTRNELPLVVLEDTDYEKLLRPVVVSASRTVSNFRPSALPNTRDPRRVRACERRGYPAWSIGPSNLVDNETIHLNGETCPVLMVDVSGWPNFKRSWIELLPQECNVVKTAIELEINQVEGFDTGGDDPMLDLGSDDLYIECVKTHRNYNNAVFTKPEPTEGCPIALVDLCDDDMVIDNDEQRARDKLPIQVTEKRPVSEIVILDDDDEEDDDIQLVESYPNPFAVCSLFGAQEESEPPPLLMSSVSEVKDCSDLDKSRLAADRVFGQAGEREESLDSPGRLKVRATEAEEESIFESGTDEDRSAHGQVGPVLPVIVVTGMEEDTLSNEHRDNGASTSDKRKREMWENLQKNFALTKVKRSRGKMDKRSRLRSRKRRIDTRPVYRSPVTTGIDSDNLSVRLLLQYVRNYSVNLSCINYFLNHYRDFSLSTFIQVSNVVGRSETFSWQRCNQKYEKENCASIEDVMGTKGCDKILSTKYSNSIVNNEETNTLDTDYQFKKCSIIETTHLFNHFLPKPVIGNAVKSKSQDLQLNLDKPNSLEVISSHEENLSNSAISNSNYNEQSNNISDIKKFKKRHSLPTALIPQQHNCAKRLRSKSHELSIKLTLKRDQSNHENWIALQNSKPLTKMLETFNFETVNVSKNSINQPTANQIICTESMYDITTKACKLNTISKEVPELEINDYENRSVAVRNINFENCLSPFLKSLVKKRSSSFRDVVNVDSDSNNLCKRRKLSDNFVNKIQKTVNIDKDLVKSLKNNSQIKDSLIFSKLSNNSKKLLPKMDPSILNTYNFLDHNNRSISVNRNIYESNSTTSSLSSNKRVSKTNLYTSEENESSDICKNSCTISASRNYDSINKHFLDQNAESCFKKEVSKNIVNSSLEPDCNINIDNNCSIEKSIEKENKSSRILKNHIHNKICKDNLLEGQEYTITINSQSTTTNTLKLKTVSETVNETSFTKITLKKATVIQKINTKDLELELHNKNQLNMVSEENQLLLQLNEFCRNNEATLQKFKTNNSKIDKGYVTVIPLKESTKKIISDYTQVELHKKNEYYKNLYGNVHKESKELECDESNKTMSVSENILECSLNSLKNKKRTANSKNADTNYSENNTSTIKFQTNTIKQKQDCSDRNSPDSPAMSVISIVHSPLNVDQVLPDSTGLDEHLEEGDFDFLTSIQKIKHNSEYNDDYDMSSDCDVEFEDRDSIEYSINMENTKKNDNLVNKQMLVESSNSKIGVYQKNKHFFETIDLKETIKLNRTHCLKKLPDFYNECITKIINNKIDGDTNIDISGLNLYISEDNDDHIQATHFKSNFSSTQEIIESEDKEMKSEIIINLDDEEIDNLKNLTFSEKENKNKESVNNEQVEKTIQTSELEQSKKEQDIEIEDMIISLCEKHVANNNVCDNLTLPMSETISSNESCNNQTTIISSDKFAKVKKDMPSSLVIVTDETTIDNDINLNRNLSAQNYCIPTSTNVLDSVKDSNSQSKIQHLLINKDKNQHLSNEVVLSYKEIGKSAHQFTDNANNDFNSSNVLEKLNISKQDVASKETTHQIPVIKLTQSKEIVSSPLIFEVSIPSTQAQSKDDYDLLKNININLVDEIDEINDISVNNSMVSSLQGRFKLRDINELLEKPKKLSLTKKISESKNSADKFISLPVPLFDINSINTLVTSELIFNKEKNNLPTENCNNQFSSLTDLIGNNSTQNLISHNSQHSYTIDQPVQTSPNMINSVLVSKNFTNCKMQQSSQQSHSQLNRIIYSSLKPNTNLTYENILQNNYSLSNNNSQSPRGHESSNINGGNRKVVLASSIYSNFYADTGVVPQHTIFTLELPPLEILALHVPYIVNMQESSNNINRKIMEYKKLLLNKIVGLLKSIETIAPQMHKEYINALLKYNTLTDSTWNFQLKIITIVQCIFSLVNITTKIKSHQILQAIVNSINLSQAPKQYLSNLNGVINLYYNLKQQGIISIYADKRQPLLLELEVIQNKNQLNTVVMPMTNEQKQEFITQARIYYKINQIHALQCQLSLVDSNYCHEYQNVKETDLLLIPSQQNTITAINCSTIQKFHSLQNSSLKDILRVLPISNTSKTPYKKKCQNSILLSNDAKIANNQIDNIKAMVETLNEQRNCSNLCLKCKKLSQIVCYSCRIATYCSRNCQQNHWIEEHHKKCKNKNLF